MPSIDTIGWARGALQSCLEHITCAQPRLCSYHHLTTTTYGLTTTSLLPLHLHHYRHLQRGIISHLPQQLSSLYHQNLATKTPSPPPKHLTTATTASPPPKFYRHNYDNLPPQPLHTHHHLNTAPLPSYHLTTMAFPLPLPLPPSALRTITSPSTHYETD